MANVERWKGIQVPALLLALKAANEARCIAEQQNKRFPSKHGGGSRAVPLKFKYNSLILADPVFYETQKEEKKRWKATVFNDGFRSSPTLQKIFRVTVYIAKWPRFADAKQAAYQSCLSEIRYKGICMRYIKRRSQRAWSRNALPHSIHARGYLPAFCWVELPVHALFIGCNASKKL